MSNPVLKRLGLSDNSRVMVFHADDIGMCQATVSAYDDLLKNSPLTSASTMVPCPWFPATAELVRQKAQHPALDMGVHLTLTAEWDAMRWSPLSTADKTTGLFDADGYFPRQTEPIQTHATVEAVSAEMRAQIERAKQAGINITHIDTHMGTLFHPRFLPAYIQMGFEYQVAVFGIRLTEKDLLNNGYEGEQAKQTAAMSDQVEAMGMPLFDSFTMMPLDSAQGETDRLGHAKNVLDSAEVGLHYFIIHPSTDTPELRALAPDWQARVGDHRLFLSDAWQNAIDASGIHVISMKTLQDLLKKG